MQSYLRIVHNFARMSWALHRGDLPVYWPLITSFYLNHRCNLSCSYCDDGTGRKYPDIEVAEMDFDDVVRCLRIMRGVNNVVSFTGGEATLRTDFPEIVKAAKEMGFITHVNTNGTIKRTLFGALPHLSALSVSLDTMDLERSDEVFGVGPGRTKLVVDNLREIGAERRRGRRIDVVVNTVIHSDNVNDVYGVLDFCREHDFGFAPLPYISGPYPQKTLVGNRDYHRLMTHLVHIKKRGFPVEATVACIEGLRDFKKFDCVPLSIARVQPNGDLYFPCNVLCTTGGNLLAVKNFRDAVDIGLAKRGYQPPHCDNRCHMSCYMDFSMILDNPTIAVVDGVYRGIGSLKRLAKRSGLN